MPIERDGRRFFEIPHAATYLLIATNILVYAICLRQAGTASIPGELLLRYGAMYRAALERHEYWRLVAAGFLHVDAIHLAGNMLCLALWGGLLERRVGAFYFVIIYFAAVIAGGVVGNLARHDPYLAVGASGGTSGILGALLCLWILAKIELTASFFVANIGLNVALTFGVRAVDWQAHLGGFAAGVIACALIDRLEWMNGLVLRCKFPEFVKVNGLVVVVGGALRLWYQLPAIDPSDWRTVLLALAVCLALVKACDLLLSVRHGLAAVVLALALANAALVPLLVRAFAPGILSVCASGHFFASIQIENAVLDTVCSDLIRTIIVAAVGVFVLTVLGYWHDLRRGIGDVGFVAATLCAERKRHRGL